MKKIIAFLILTALVLSCCGCGNQTNGKYKLADYETYSKQDLDYVAGDDYIYFSGQVEDVKEDNGDIHITVDTEEGSWLAVFFECQFSSEFKDSVGYEYITCYGKFYGQSSGKEMPIIELDKIEVGSDTIDKSYFEKYSTVTATTKATAETTTVSVTTKPTPKKENTNKVVFNNRGIKVTYTGIEYNDYYTGLKLLIENNSGSDYAFQFRDTSVNGYMIDPVFSCKVKNGKKANDVVMFDDEKLKENNINTIKSVEFSLHVFDWDDYSNTFDSKMITLNV